MLIVATKILFVIRESESISLERGWLEEPSLAALLSSKPTHCPGASWPLVPAKQIFST